MLNLGRLTNLSQALGISLDDLHGVLDDFDVAPDRLVHELTLWHPDASKKPRDVICILRPWRHIQSRIYSKLLLPWFEPEKSCHGGVKRRSTATNARRHIGNTHAFVADIADFFPSINRKRVNRLFLSKACRPEVASALTRLCTYDHHLALGLITSPIIANELLGPIDREIQTFCRHKGLVYSRFIDDITISGRFDLRKCKVQEAIEQTLQRHNFRAAPGKSNYGPLNQGGDQQLEITGVRLKFGHLDASRGFVRELDRILGDHLSLSKDGPFVGPLYMEGEVFGKVYHAISLNSGRRRGLLAKMKRIDWFSAVNCAAERGLVRHVKRFTRRGEARPDGTLPMPLAAGAKFVREYYGKNQHDPSQAPF